MLRVPLRTPFKTALRTVEQVEDIVLSLRTDTGLVGYGSAPATAVITGDTHASIVQALRGHLLPLVLDRDLEALDATCAQVQAALPRNTNAKAALEIALHDLHAQARGIPLYRLLGDGAPTLRTDITISVDGIDKMVADTQAALARGFDALKVKVGNDLPLDIARIRAVHAAVAGRARLRLDANQGWSAEQAIAALQALEAEGIVLELVEQPVPAADVEGLRQVAARVRTPVMADEAVFGSAQADDLLATHAAHILNIKLMKAGGLSDAQRIADVCARHQRPAMVGCMLESSIGVAAAAHFAVARSDVVRFVDLDGPSLCTHDPVDGGVRFDGARIHVTDAPGLGIRSIAGLAPLPPGLA